MKERDPVLYEKKITSLKIYLILYSVP